MPWVRVAHDKRMRGSNDSAELRTLPADPPPGQMERLPAGTYATGKFEPALTLEVGEGWKLLEERQHYFGLSWHIRRGGDSTIYFINPPPEGLRSEQSRRTLPCTCA